MADEIFSIAIFQPVPGAEQQALATMRLLKTALEAGGYSRDQLYRDPKSKNQYFLLRWWKSEESRRAALEDPEVLRCYAKLSREIEIIKIYDTLEAVPTST